MKTKWTILVMALIGLTMGTFRLGAEEKGSTVVSLGLMSTNVIPDEKLVKMLEPKEQGSLLGGVGRETCKSADGATSTGIFTLTRVVRERFVVEIQCRFRNVTSISQGAERDSGASFFAVVKKRPKS